LIAASPESSSTLPPWRASTQPATIARLLIVIALLGFVYENVVRNQLVDRWMSDGNWSHGMLIPLLSVYFLSQRREELSSAVWRPNYWGAVILAGSLFVFFFSAWRLRMAYPQAVSIVGSIFGLVLLLGGWSVMRVAWFPILFLLLAIPLPDRLYVELTMPLRRWASTAAAALLPILAPGLHAQAQAVVIDYVLPGRPPGTLNVEEACSGMRLLMAFVTLGVGMAYLGERAFWQRIVMVVACIPIALFCNTIRVTVTGLLQVYGDSHPAWLQSLGIGELRDLSHGTPHQLLGILMLVLALGLFSLLGYVLGHLYVESSDEG